MSAIFKREFKSYFNGFAGYIFAAFLLAFEGVYVVIVNLLSGYASFEFTLENIMVVFLLIVPIISMRSIAEERHSRTDQLLYSLPIKTSSIVLGKYFALLAVLLIPTLIIGVYPLILNFFGNVNILNAYACLLAFYMLAAALMSICMFTSSLTESQIVAAVLGGTEYEMFDEFDIDYVCTCSRERYLAAIAGLSANDVRDLCEKGEPIEAVCHFCNAAYTFEPSEIMAEYLKKIEK